MRYNNERTDPRTLIQRFGSAGNLNIHLHCLFLDGVYRIDGDVPVFQFVRAPTVEQLQTLLTKIIKRIMKLLTRRGYIIGELMIDVDRWGHIWSAPYCKDKFVCDKKNIAPIYPALG